MVYYKRYYKKLNTILSENFPLVYLIYLTTKKIAQLLKLAEGKEKMTELLFDKLNDKPKLMKVMKNNQIKENTPKVNPAINNNFNLRPYNRKNHSNSIKILRSDKSGISLMSQFDSQKFNINNLNEINQNIEQDNYINQIFYVRSSNYEKGKQLFPFRYYLFSEFIKNIDISQYYRCCFSRKFTKVYTFIGKLFDISSYLILQREFNIIKNYIFKQKELNMIERDMKINLNHHSFMRDINDCIGGAKFNIFSKNIKDYNKCQ